LLVNQRVVPTYCQHRGQGQPPRRLFKYLPARPIDPPIADTAAAPVRLVFPFDVARANQQQ